MADAEILIDGRNLEPPEPFVKTMEALDTLAPGQKLRLRLIREPFPLYRALELNGYLWHTAALDDGTYEILMWPKGCSRRWPQPSCLKTAVSWQSISRPGWQATAAAASVTGQSRRCAVFARTTTSSSSTVWTETPRAC